MREQRAGEVVTDASLVGALRVAAQGGTPLRRRRPVTYEVRVGPAVAHASVIGGRMSVEPGGHPGPDLVHVAGPGFRDLLARVLAPTRPLLLEPLSSSETNHSSPTSRPPSLCPTATPSCPETDRKAEGLGHQHVPVLGKLTFRVTGRVHQHDRASNRPLPSRKPNDDRTRMSPPGVRERSAYGY